MQMPSRKAQFVLRSQDERSEMKCLKSLFVAVLLLTVIGQIFGLPVGQPEENMDVMMQVPQWHCMRYRKFELVRRCRSFKNGIRRYNNRTGELVEMH